MSRDEIMADIVSRDELAEILNLSPRTIQRYGSLPNGLPSVRIGGRAMYRVASVKKWIESREQHPNPVVTRSGRRSG